MISLESLIIIGLAVWQAVEIWRHSELFASWRADIETWPILDDDKFRRMGPASRRHYRITAFIRDLLSCPWCLSVWVALLLGALWLLPWWLWWLNIPTVALAASRAANLFNDVAKAHRTNREES